MQSAYSPFRVLQARSPEDKRLSSVRNLNQHFEFPEYPTRKAWESRAREIRQHILVCCGLYPEPERGPLNAQISRRIERDGYSIERVHFESYPGFLVTGNLYRPMGKSGPLPGVLSPHGHWDIGRFGHNESGSVIGRAINLALQGYVTFTYDMVGYNDSMQVPHRTTTVTRELWGLNLMGLHLWNSIRSIDFLQSLPDVDPDRIGCTGASGGGTQTFMLAAVDERIKVSAPVCMVSAYMQGGCLCENTPGMRQDIMNTEIAALAAPRPQILVSASGDWTQHNPVEEYPDLRSIYKLYGAADRVKNVHFDAGHNYNQDSCEAVYTFFRRWLAGAKSTRKVKPIAFEIEATEDLLVFPDKKLPRGIATGEKLIENIVVASKRQLDAGGPANPKELAAFRDRMGPALSHTLNVCQPGPGEVEGKSTGVEEGQGFGMEKFLVGRRSVGDQIPSLLFESEKPRAKGPCVLLVHSSGKGALVDERQGLPGESVQALLAKGMRVLAIDAFLTGEYQTAGGQVGRNLNGITHWTTYNRTDHAERVQDILTAIAFLTSCSKVSDIHLVGLGRAGVWSMLARALTGSVSRTVIDADRFDNDSDEAWSGELYVPGIRRCGDVTTAGILVAPAPMMVMNTGKKFSASATARAYRAVGEPRLLRLREEPVPPKAIANYLMSNQ